VLLQIHDPEQNKTCVEVQEWALKRKE